MKPNMNSQFSNRNINFRIALMDYGIDITGEVERIDLFFDFSGLPYGTIILNDVNHNIFDTFPLMGGEFIFISAIHDISNAKLFSKIMRISEVELMPTDVTIGNTRTKYKIHLVSKFKFNGAMRKISRGYVGVNTTSEIVHDIFKTDFGLTDKEEYIIFNSNTHLDNYIITWCNPLDEVNYLKKVSSDIYEKDFYVFFEDMRTLNFMPISVLVNASPIYQLQRKISYDIEKDGIPLLHIEKEKFISGVNVLRSLEGGNLGETTLYFNIKDKTTDEVSIKMDSEFLDSMVTMGESSYYNKKVCDYAEMSNYKLGLPRHETTNKFTYYNMRKELFNIFNIKMCLPGTLDLDIGRTVYVEFPQNHDEIDSLLSGTWIIKQLHLNINMRDPETDTFGFPQFSTEIIIAKDAFGMVKKNIKELTDFIQTTTNVNNNIIMRELKTARV